MSAADQATLMKAKTQGTVFKNKTEAQQAFASSPEIKAKYPATFQAEPAVRPNYIPQSTSLNGMSYPVTYNAFQGGYGFMGPLGAWIMYDALSDAAMRDNLMRQNNYVVQTAEAMPAAAPVTTVVPPVQPVHRGTSFFNIFFGLLVLGGVVGLLVTLARKTSKF
ncbi:MAG TPA: hypothetical protein PLA90_16515 [Candidatus Sumerlaeota bacterium]|nr:hypothetical protein [Candidatus Sumerlaeota bacterium]HPS03145.1 hypothetical protein [Candidatus Sumerlaeota bacterium]